MCVCVSLIECTDGVEGMSRVSSDVDESMWGGERGDVADPLTGRVLEHTEKCHSVHSIVMKITQVFQFSSDSTRLERLLVGHPLAPSSILMGIFAF